MSLEEKILLYEELILATEQTDMAKEKLGIYQRREYMPRNKGSWGQVTKEIS